MHDPGDGKVTVSATYPCLPIRRRPPSGSRPSDAVPVQPPAERDGELPAGLDQYRDLYRLVAYLLVPQTFEDWSSRAEQPVEELEVEVREEFDERLAAVP